jgi:hypothetical protein
MKYHQYFFPQCACVPEALHIKLHDSTEYLHYITVSTLLAISHRHIEADVGRITDQSLVHQREESSSQK